MAGLWARKRGIPNRKFPAEWTRYGLAAGRIRNQQMIDEVAWPAADGPLAYACGPTSFVEAVASDLVAFGYPARRIRTERFGATGQ